MPKPRIAVRSKHLVKYAFPVVRSIIDEIGGPREIEKVPPLQRGPLLVTLTVNISSDCTREICSRLETSTEGDYLPLESLIPDMFEGMPVDPGGAGHLLLLKNARWWTEFAEKAETRFRTLANSSGPIRIMHLSAVAHEAANDPAWKNEKNRSYDAAWLEIVENPQKFFASGRWPRQSLISTSTIPVVRRWRSTLNKEDSQERAWILQKSGGFHPSVSSYWEPTTNRIPEYSVWRAHNELYYCLSQGDTGLWVPFSSDSFTEEDWKDWLHIVTFDNPPYWAPSTTL